MSSQPTTIYTWQPAYELAERIGKVAGHIQNQAARYAAGGGYVTPIQRKPNEHGDDEFIYRIDPESGWQPMGGTLSRDHHYWLEWSGYIDVCDGEVDRVVKSYFFHDVEPAEARKMATEYCERANGGTV